MLANSKEGKAFTDSHGNLVFIDFIVPGGGRHGVCLAKKLWEVFDTGLSLVILCNFALGRAVPCRGTFAYITGVIP